MGKRAEASHANILLPYLLVQVDPMADLPSPLL
jgi:hypothetical protein